MRLGIDFGTTRTVIAAATGGRYPVAAVDTGAGYAEYVPGIAAAIDGRWQFGWDAVGRLGEADGVIRSLKRAVATRAPDDCVGADMGAPTTALELVTGFLRYVRQLISTHSNLDVAIDATVPVHIAVPANASSRQRYTTLEAFTRAGFEVTGLVNEPTAAAVEFAQRNLAGLTRRSPKRYVVVYDLGGGTFDTAAVALAGRRFELLATEGIARLGGDDFDDVLLDMALVAADIAGDELSSAHAARALELCREAKERLGPNSRKLLVDLGAVVDGAPAVVVATSDLYARCDDYVAATLRLLDRVFERLPDHGIDPDNPRELGGVYLVGGAVQFPAVLRALRQRYQRKLQLAVQPHAATAVGLAICADPDAGVLVREATTRHFGVWREGAGGRDKVFDSILCKDTAPPGDEPIVVHRIYRPNHTIGWLRFMECGAVDAGGQPTGDVTPWARIVFPYASELADHAGLEALPVERCDAGDEIAETYTYARDGTIRVDIANRSRGYRREFVLGSLA